MLQTLLIICVLISCGICQGDKEQALKEFEARIKPYKKFKKYIKCQACELASESIFSTSQLMSSGMDENMIYDLVRDACNPWSNIGGWITKMDITLNGKRELKLIDQNDIGECKAECEVLLSLCTETISPKADMIAQYIWNNRDKIDNQILKQYTCSDVCNVDNSTPKISKKLAKKYKTIDQKWIKMTEEEKQKRRRYFEKLKQKRNSAHKEL